MHEGGVQKITSHCSEAMCLPMLLSRSRTCGYSRESRDVEQKPEAGCRRTHQVPLPKARPLGVGSACEQEIETVSRLHHSIINLCMHTSASGILSVPSSLAMPRDATGRSANFAADHQWKMYRAYRTPCQVFRQQRLYFCSVMGLFT